MTLELFIYDQIGPDSLGFISAARVVAELKKAGSQRVVVRLNSPGGDVFEAEAIYNALLRHAGEVDVEIDAVAASAASLVAMAGRRISIAENARVMIHRAWTIAMGNAADLEKTIGLLRSVDNTILDTYAARTGQPRVTLSAWLDEEKWFTADEAVRYRFADSIGQRLRVAARIDARKFRNAPASMFSRGDPRHDWRQTTLTAAQFRKPEPGLVVSASAGRYSPEHVALVCDLRKRALGPPPAGEL